MKPLIKLLGKPLVALIAAASLCSLARADEIVGTHYGSQIYGAPFAVALKKGYFRQQGLDISGILTAKGGGTSVRNLLAGDTLYAEVALPAALSAIQEGFPIKIVSGGTDGNPGYWVTRVGESIQRPEDLKGKRFLYTRPKSVTESVIIAILRSHNLNAADVKLVALDQSAGLAALEQGKVDIVPLPEPMYTQKVREGVKLQVIPWLEAKLPPYTQTVGVATDETIAKRGDKLRAAIVARRQAVDFIYAHPQEAAAIVAEAYNMPPDLVRTVMGNTLKRFPAWWSPAHIRQGQMEKMAEALASVEALKLPIPWKNIVDDRFVPIDQKGM